MNNPVYYLPLIVMFRNAVFCFNIAYTFRGIHRLRIQDIPHDEALCCTECWYTRLVTQDVNVLFLVWCQSELEVDKNSLRKV